MLSFGVAVSPSGRTFGFDEVFQRADAALYEAKEAGRNRVCPEAAAAASRAA